MPRHLSRFRFLLASAVLLLLVPVSGALAQARHKLTQAGFRVLYMAPAFIALEKGFFAQEGVDFTFTELDSGALGAAAVISGNAQISDLDPLGVARLQQEGKSLLLFYNLVGRVTLDLIVRTPVARLGLTAETALPARYAALKGLNIGITRPGAPTDVFARSSSCAPDSTPIATPRSSRWEACRPWRPRSRATASTPSCSRRLCRRPSSARARVAS